MWIQRLLSQTLNKAFAQFPVVVLTGARQVGKTSLVRRLFPDADYVTLDIPREAEAARLDFDGFLERHREPLIIDEVQYEPGVFRHLKILIDRDRRAGRFILTGSQDFSLMRGVTESLAGRCAVLSLPSLSLDEIRPGATITDTVQYCWRGGFPNLWQTPQMDRDLWLGSYVATYLERDVRNLLNVGNLRDFDRFLRASALRAGQLLSLSELARDVGVAPNTAKSWISMLQASSQIFLLEPYHSNATKRLVKTPKLYFSDSGLLTYLLGFSDSSSLMQNAAWGAIWENLVVSEAHKHFLNRGRRPPLWFWRTVQGEEVDLLIEAGPKEFLAVECKTAAQVGPSDVRGFTALQKAYGTGALKKGCIVCRTDKAYPLSAGGAITALPLGGPGGLSAWIQLSA